MDDNQSFESEFIKDIEQNTSTQKVVTVGPSKKIIIGIIASASILLAAFIVFLVIVKTVPYEETMEPSIEGIWVCGDGHIYKFFEDGTFVVRTKDRRGSSSGSYIIEGQKLALSVGKPFSYEGVPLFDSILTEGEHEYDVAVAHERIEFASENMTCDRTDDEEQVDE